MRSQLKLELRPNNQITLTHGNWRKPEKLAYKSAKLTHNEVLSERQGKRKIPKMVEKYQENREFYDSKRDLYQWRLEKAKNQPSQPLDIILKSQRGENYPSVRLNKPKSFTKNSGQKLRECGAAIDIACGQDTRFCHEVTLTLPANTCEAFTALAGYSSYIINRLFQPIRRNYGDMCLWFFVWEYQKRGALHIHVCVYHPDECEGLYISSQLIEQWHKILCDLCDLADTDMFLSKKKDRCTIRQNHQHHTAPIKKAVGSYFSKYAGKEESKSSWYCQKYPISRFWGSCYALKKIIKSYSLKFDLDLQNEENSERWYQMVLDNILKKLDITAFNSYDFDIQLQGKARLNRCKDGKKYLSKDRDSKIASGTRHVFYINPSQLNQAMDLLNALMKAS